MTHPPPAVPPLPLVEMDGRPATEDDLRVPALHGFGPFTAMQVRDRKVRGLGPHLDRLEAAYGSAAAESSERRPGGRTPP